MTNSIPDRAHSRKVIRVGQRPARRSGVVSSAEIEAAVAASGIPDEPSDIKKDKSGKVIKPLRSKPVLEGEKSANPEERKLYGK
jgi:hypothetical protein